MLVSSANLETSLLQWLDSTLCPCSSFHLGISPTALFIQLSIKHNCWNMPVITREEASRGKQKGRKGCHIVKYCHIWQEAEALRGMRAHNRWQWQRGENYRHACLDILPSRGNPGVQYSFISILIARISYRLTTTILTPKELHLLQQSYRWLASSNAASSSTTVIYAFYIIFHSSSKTWSSFSPCSDSRSLTQGKRRGFLPAAEHCKISLFLTLS